MKAVIRIRGLEIPASIGVSEAEREVLRKLTFQASLHLRSYPDACRSDEITGTVDYGAVIRTIEAVVRAKSYQTLEYLGDQIISAVFEGYPEVEHMTLDVAKPHPPVPQSVQETAVEFSCSRRDTIECHAGNP